MSSIERSLRGALCSYALTFTACVSVPAQQTQSPVVCPASITVTESAIPVPGWTVGAARVPRSFERISIYNGNAGGREFELAPDGQKEEGNQITQTWYLKGYRTMNVFLRCRYHDTPVALQMDLAPKVETCTLRFSADKKGCHRGVIKNGVSVAIRK